MQISVVDILRVGTVISCDKKVVLSRYFNYLRTEFLLNQFNTDIQTVCYFHSSNFTQGLETRVLEMGKFERDRTILTIKRVF